MRVTRVVGGYDNGNPVLVGEIFPDIEVEIGNEGIGVEVANPSRKAAIEQPAQQNDAVEGCMPRAKTSADPKEELAAQVVLAAIFDHCSRTDLQHRFVSVRIGGLQKQY